MENTNSQQSPSAFEMVRQFHEKFGLAYDGKPRVLPADIQALRLVRLTEELEEYCNAVNENNLEAMLDALVDLQYILLGTAELHGFTRFDEAFARVHAANMTKERALRAEDSKHDSTYDIIKPTGWAAPNLSDLVE